MRQTIWLLVLLLASASVGVAQESKRGGYAGEERREIKSLSAEEVEGLLQGRGMGLARAAELNHYPGPHHVLELAERLELTAEQRAGAQAAFEKMRARAILHGAKIVELERELDELFAKGQIEDARMRELTAEIGQAQGLLRAAHLAAHLEMRRLLSPRQIARYDELRGYTTGRKTGAAHDGHGKH
ncbi:MAG TPA: hypothetical protein VEY11_20290 [Pyrinomonadaceae bacterium]|nr:hypothetical protein [Pyrinomonadaceae bacterium]